MRDRTQHTGRELEVWGGIECTVNRIGDSYIEQLTRNGHDERISDLEMFADLGISAIRYPVLWERTETAQRVYDFRWADERLNRLRELNVEPIVGLVHHGSGPRHTSLVDPEFPEKLAHYAGSVAERFPWVEKYTPINEPLTTARFSGLYGLWYPHGRDDQTFLRCLYNEVKGTILAMQAIRRVNPNAKLVQTEDLGKVHSTDVLRHQANFENERRWLPFDMLCGRVDRKHKLYGFLVRNGIAREELDWLQRNSCPPDICGFNYYITSERFLDHRLELYPAHLHGGNGFQKYVDVEAVRVLHEGVSGPHTLLREAWNRFRLPLALTEAHMGCTREEQMRWLLQIWGAAMQLQHEGVDMRAVTAWSLLGSFDWNSLLTRNEGHYEPGIFDVRSGTPRPTALAGLIRSLAKGEPVVLSGAEGHGWWERDMRLLAGHGPAEQPIPDRTAERRFRPRMTRRPPILITGATGTLGQAYARICQERNLEYRLLGRKEMDIADRNAIARALRQHKPWALVNAAGYVRVDDAEVEEERCMQENATGPALLAEACSEAGVRLLTFSSDLVFDGRKGQPYVESDPVSPINAYGRAKAEAERKVLEIATDALIVRCSAFFGPWDHHNFLYFALQALESGQPFHAAEDAMISPTYVPDLVNASLDILFDQENGIWHLANRGALTWAEFARMAAERSGLDGGLVIGRPTTEFQWAAPRPLYSVLGSERGHLLPTLENALERFLLKRREARRGDSLIAA